MNREDPLELTEKARALLRAHEPPPIAEGFERRVLERLERTLGLPPVPPVAPPPPPAAAGGLGLAKALLITGGLVALSVGLTIGLPKAVHVGAPTKESAPSTVSSLSSEFASPPFDANEKPTLPPETPDPRVPSAPIRQTTTKVAAGVHSGSAMASASGTSSNTAGSTLAEERALLAAARSALADGKGSTALSLLSTHAQRFPAGRLSEERESLTIQALARNGAVDAARQRLAALRKRSPRSIFLPALEATLGAAP